MIYKRKLNLITKDGDNLKFIFKITEFNHTRESYDQLNKFIKKLDILINKEVKNIGEKKRKKKRFTKTQNLPKTMKIRFILQKNRLSL